MERVVEKFLYASRWLLAPVYLGLSLVMLAVALKFFQEIFHVLPNIFQLMETELILLVLTLIDLALVGSLIVMVMFSGYENFVSRIDVADDSNKLEWLGKLDAGDLKNKVAASIVAISSIHLLKIFMDVTHIDNDKIMWYVIIHMTFVLSAFVMGYLSKMGKH